MTQYPTLVYPDTATDGSFCYVAEHPDLPGCAAHGVTLDEAKERLAQAREAYLRHLRDVDEPIPEPGSTTPTSVEWQSAEADVDIPEPAAA